MLASALALFGLIYLLLKVTALSLGATAMFLLVVFRLAPVVKQVSDYLYGIDGQLPHLVAVHQRLAKLGSADEPDSGTERLPTTSRRSRSRTSRPRMTTGHRCSTTLHCRSRGAKSQLAEDPLGTTSRPEKLAYDLAGTGSVRKVPYSVGRVAAASLRYLLWSVSNRVPWRSASWTR